MTDDVASQVIKAEQDRIQCLLDVDRGTYDRLHAAEYRLCNPTGTVWTKAEYFDLLTSGRVAYRELGLTGDVDAIVGTDRRHGPSVGRTLTQHEEGRDTA